MKGFIDKDQFVEIIEELVSMYNKGLLKNYPQYQEDWDAHIQDKEIIVIGDRASINWEVVDKLTDKDFQ